MRYDRIVDFDPFSDGFGIMRASPDSKAAGVQDRRRLVRIQPGDQWQLDLPLALTIFAV